MSNRIRNWAVAGTFTLAAVGGLAAAAIATPGDDSPRPSTMNTTVTAKPIASPGPTASREVASPFADLEESGTETMESAQTAATALSVSAQSVQSTQSPVSPKSPVSQPSPVTPPAANSAPSPVSPPSPVTPPSPQSVSAPSPQSAQSVGSPDSASVDSVD